MGTASSVSAHVKGSLRTAGKQAINTERSNRTPAKSAGSDAQLEYESTYKGRDIGRGYKKKKKGGGKVALSFADFIGFVLPSSFIFILVAFYNLLSLLMLHFHRSSFVLFN